MTLYWTVMNMMANFAVTWSTKKEVDHAEGTRFRQPLGHFMS